jgi:hypothetical protein
MLAVIALFLLCCPSWLPGEPIHRKLNARVQRYTLSEPTFIDGVITVASRFEIPVGIELLATPAVSRPVKRSWRNVTVLQILSSLVDGETGYRLRVDGGVVHVFREDVVDQRSNFLNIRVPKFDVQNATAGSAEQMLWRLLNTRLHPLPPTNGPRGGIGFSLAERTDTPTFDLHLRDATVRQIFDRIALLSKHKVWVAAFARGSALMPSGFRRTVSLTKPGFISDAGQPGWKSLRWGEKPY